MLVLQKFLVFPCKLFKNSWLWRNSHWEICTETWNQLQNTDEIQYMKLSTKISVKRKIFVKLVKFISWFIVLVMALFRDKSFTITPGSWSAGNQVPEIFWLFLLALLQFRRVSFTSTSLIYKYCVLHYKSCNPNTKANHLYHDFTDIKSVMQAKINKTNCQNS